MSPSYCTPAGRSQMLHGQPHLPENHVTSEPERIWIAMDSPEVLLRYRRQPNGKFIQTTSRTIVQETWTSRKPNTHFPSRDDRDDAGRNETQVTESTPQKSHMSESLLNNTIIPKFNLNSSEKSNNDLKKKTTQHSTDSTASCTIRKKSKPKEGKEHCYDKSNYCTFCGKEICSKITRHLLDVHHDHPAVGDIRFLEKQSPERMVLLEILVNEGNFKHNVQVLKENKGHLVVARRASPDQDGHNPDAYIPCEHCKKFVLKFLLWNHIKNCKVRKFHQTDESKTLPELSDPEDPDCEKNFVRRGRQILASAMIDSSESIHSALFARMHDDDITRVAENDGLIRKIGYLRMEGLGDEDCQKQRDVYRVCQAVRTLARLVIQARNEKPGSSLSSLLTAANFDIVVRATKAITIKDSNALTLAGKIGNLLGHAAVTKIGQGLRQNNDNMVDEANKFKQIFDAKWMYRVNKVAMKLKSKEDMKKKPNIPLAGDLKIFRNFIMSRCATLTNEVRSEPSPSAWAELCRTILFRLIMFNKRRVSEVSELKLETFLERPVWSEADMEFDEAMTPVERKFAQR